MLAGVDEAGRGPVLGPLVVAGVLVETDAQLRELGVKDSKRLSPAKREALEPQIRAIARDVEIVVITPQELNKKMPKTNLNKIEVHAFAAIIKKLQPSHAILDACDVNAARFGQNVATRAKLATCVIQSEHEADKNHPVVAAASIIAKVHRDQLMRDLAKEIGECGSGYSSDKVTRAFLEAWVKKHGHLPPFARHEWETSRRLTPRVETTLETFTRPRRGASTK